jgi:hypothetical protein
VSNFKTAPSRFQLRIAVRARLLVANKVTGCSIQGTMLRVERSRNILAGIMLEQGPQLHWTTSFDE